MRHFLVFVLLAAFVILGCGGSSASAGGSTTSLTGSSGGNPTTGGRADAFVGSWSGSWNQINGNDPLPNGTMALMIVREPGAENGVTISGAVHDNVRGDGTVRGQITDNNGGFIAFDLPNGLGSAFFGYPKIDARGHFAGQLGDQDGDGGASLKMTLDLARTP